jgi:hypothetical protein
MNDTEKVLLALVVVAIILLIALYVRKNARKEGMLMPFDASKLDPTRFKLQTCMYVCERSGLTGQQRRACYNACCDTLIDDIADAISPPDDPMF